MGVEMRFSESQKSNSVFITPDDTRPGNDANLTILEPQQGDSLNKKNATHCSHLVKRMAVGIAALVTVLLVIGVICAAIYLPWDQQPTLQTTNVTKISIGPSAHQRKWTLVSRENWGSWKQLKDSKPLSHPVHLVIVAHTAGVSCESRIECSSRMQNLQDYSVGHLGKPDVPFNFLIGHDGNAYEGVGWNFMATFSKAYNNCSISIAYIGNYIRMNTTSQQLQAMKQILHMGVQLKKLTPDYILVAHNLTTATLSPGTFVYEQIKDLNHFTDDERLLPF
ncbi:peptidoglycan-recognition protein SC1a-like [Hetaerina americana]|uniref:peptidoglycan-recognition protein SC1a-like n=1 Tax=Hetaerina americana TaxID=62018 RepID=UPI003A7F45F7